MKSNKHKEKSKIRPSDERTTSELIAVLGKDFERLDKRMFTSVKRGYVSAADASHARNLVRCLFALVEGVTFSLKIDACSHLLETKRHVPRGIIEMVLEERYDLNDKGKVITRTAKITLERNIKFAFQLFSDSYRIPNHLKTNSEWWHALKRSDKVRDRLMHPREPEDLDISPKEIVDAITAESGFRKIISMIIAEKKKKEKRNKNRCITNRSTRLLPAARLVKA